MATAYPGGLRKRGGLLDYEDTIQATPRNAFFGGVADLLGQAYKLPEMPRLGVPGLDFVAANRNRLMDLLGVGDVQKTAEAMAYGNRLGTGRGMTYQPLPETMGAALAVAPMVAPAARMVGKGAVETSRFVAPKAGQLAEQYMVKTGGILPLDVYHGTPHRFPPTPRNPLGEFDASKIGTGEGAQVYGHGIYMAENPDVAKDYMFTLAGDVNAKGSGYYPKIDGKVVYDDFEDFDIVKKIAYRTDPIVGIRGGNRQAISSDEAIAELIAKNKLIADDPVYYPEARAEALNEIQDLQKYLGKKIEPSKPSVYKVDLPDEKIAKMLDWDKPLSQQPANVRKALAQYMDGSDTFISPAGGSLYNPSGKQIYESITGGADAFSGKKSEISAKKLRDLGILGVQYLDSGSRNVGKGTRNFVVFPGEEKSMTILERNAQKADELKRLQAGGLLAP